MKLIIYNIYTAFFISFSLTMFSACDNFKGSEGSTGPVGPTGPGVVYIKGFVINDESGTNNSASIIINNCKSVPSVALNGKNIKYDTNLVYANSNHVTGYSFSETFETPFQTATIEAAFTSIDGKEGNAAAQITVPGHFEITEYSPNETSRNQLPFSSDEAITVSWSSSDNAEIYVVYVYGLIEYKIQNETSRFDSEVNFIITNTSIEIPLTDLFHESVIKEIDEIERGYIYFYLHALSGPHNPGDQGNITGDAEGMFYGMRSVSDISFDITLPIASKQILSSTEKNKIYHNSPMYEFIDSWLQEPSISFIELIEKGK